MIGSSTFPRFHLFKQYKPPDGSELPRFPESATFITLAIDELSFVRSALGYAAGEQVLDLCGERLVSETRDGDIVISLGGDTFATILSGFEDPVAISHIAERLIERLERSYLIDGHLVDIQVRAGIAISSEHQNDFDGLLGKSSLALRAARSDQSRTPRFFEQAMESGLFLEQALIRDLRRALPLRQFHLHYQVQVDMSRRKVAGVEALLRWEHPVRGSISPAIFIPIAESTGAIHALGAWVLRTACKQAATLPEEIVMAVNVSPLQLRSPTFVRDVTDALHAAKLPGSRLEIEITEGILLDTSSATLSTVRALNSLGVKFAIDDFGTGHSSLGQIGRFPFHSIKIDRSLVGGDSKHRAVVRAVVALASGLGLTVLAEGVENEQDLHTLQLDGCSLFQGYFFGKPVAAPKIMGLVKEIETARALPGVAVLTRQSCEAPQSCFRRSRTRRRRPVDSAR